MAKKQKLTLADLAPKPYTFELEHPVHGKIGSTITMVGADSIEFIQHSASVAKRNGALDIEKLTPEDVLKHTAEIYVPLVLEWDEELFGVCDKENKLKVLSDISNQWVMKQIEAVFTDKQLFFAK